MIHHIAIFTPSPETLAKFYRTILNLEEPIAVHKTPEGNVRSVWLSLGKTILMLEKGEVHPGNVVIFDLPKHYKKLIEESIVQMEKRTEFTIYFSDSSGNKIGFSTYPEPLPF